MHVALDVQGRMMEVVRRGRARRRGEGKRRGGVEKAMGRVEEWREGSAGGEDKG